MDGLVRRRGWLALLAASGLAGCGFELRRPPELKFRTIALVGFGDSPMGGELRMQLNSSANTKVVDSPNQAEVVFEVLSTARERSVVASTAAAQVREIQLRSRLIFRLRTRAGRELIPRTELGLSRDISYSETIALAQEQEEALVFRAMETDLVDQVMRRLAAVQAV